MTTTAAPQHLIAGLFCVLLSSSCDQPQPQHQPLAALYKELQATATPQPPATDDPPITISALNTPLANFLRTLATQTGCSFICETGQDTKPITLELRNIPLSQAMSAITRRLGAQLAKTGNLYYIGQLRAEDRAILVRHVPYLAPDEITNTIGTTISETGKHLALPNGTLIASDRVEVLARINDLLDQLAQQDTPTWILQFYLLDTTTDATKDLGLDTTASADIGLTFATNSATTTPHINANLSTLFHALITDTRSNVAASPMALAAEGQHVLLSSGQDIPVPKRSTSNEGTTTTTGYETVSAGLSIDAITRTAPNNHCRLTLKAEISSISGFKEDAPIKALNRIQTEITANTGGIYLLAEIAQDSDTRTTTGPLQLHITKSKTHKIWQLWLRSYKIGGPPDALPSLYPNRTPRSNNHYLHPRSLPTPRDTEQPPISTTDSLREQLEPDRQAIPGLPD